MLQGICFYKKNSWDPTIWVLSMGPIFLIIKVNRHLVHNTPNFGWPTTRCLTGPIFFGHPIYIHSYINISGPSSFRYGYGSVCQLQSSDQALEYCFTVQCTSRGVRQQIQEINLISSNIEADRTRVLLDLSQRRSCKISSWFLKVAF